MNSHELITQTANCATLIAPTLVRQFGGSDAASVESPVGTITAGGGGKTALVSAFLAKHFGGVAGVPVDTPLPTTTARGTQTQIVAAALVRANLMAEVLS